MFTGSIGNKRRINLGGSSKGAETREQILERSKLERDRRKRNKLEASSATVIQAAWRAKHDLSIYQQACSRQWCEQYGSSGERVPGSATELAASCLVDLLAFANPSNFKDVQAMAGTAQVILTTHDTQGNLKFAMEGTSGKVKCARVQIRSKRLLKFIIKAFVAHSTSFGTHQRPAVWSKLLDLACKLIDPKTWQPVVGPDQSSSLAASLIGYLATQCHLFSDLAHLLLGGCHPAAAAEQSAAQISLPEALASNLTVRFLSLSGHPEVAAAKATLPRLMCVPLLWSRCPRVLLSVSGRIWHHAVEALHTMQDAHTLIAWLPADQLGGKAGAAGALLANLAQVGGTALQSNNSTASSSSALHFSQVATLLLAVVPMNSLLKVSDTVMADIDDEEEEQPEASTSDYSSDTLHWPEHTAIPFEQYVHLHSLAEPALLKALVQRALPATAPSSSTSPAMLAIVRSLCQMLQALTGVSALCQKALIFTAHQADFVRRLWHSYLQAAWASNQWTPTNDSTLDPGWMLPTVVLSRVYSSYLNTAPDAHMYGLAWPLPLEELYDSYRPEAGLLALLKFALWQVLWVESSSTSMSPAAKALRGALKESAGKLLTQLYDRNCRRRFAPSEAFQTGNLSPERFHAEMQTAANAAGGLMQATNTRVWGLLRHAPFLISFQERAEVFTTLVGQDRMEQRGMGGHGWGQFFVTIHRTSLLQDGFEQLNKLQEGLKSRVQIRFIDRHGIEEAGIDGGGLFKEFMECLVKEGFDPNAGLFKATSDNRLYPNPSAQALVPDALAYFEFLGRMLGKAMYEGILVELPLAGFFLKKMRNPHSDINDLVTLDPELYRNLMFLRDYDGDFADLALTFTTADNDVGQSREVELVPNGGSKAVTAENVMEYVHRVANYRLNFQIKAASEAFWRGFYDLVTQDWVTMFNEEEVQMLISGGGEGLNVADMQAHVNYAGGYHEEHPVIVDFWKAVASFSPEQQSLLLKFITACSRAPLLGFRFLEPGLSIQMAGSILDSHASDRLPTAATCMNLLKLPPYRSAEQIRDKLLYAAQNASGFGLS